MSVDLDEEVPNINSLFSVKVVKRSGYFTVPRSIITKRDLLKAALPILEPIWKEWIVTDMEVGFISYLHKVLKEK